MGHLQTRGNLSKQGETFPNKERPFQTRGNLSKQGKTPPNKETAFQASRGYLPLKCKSLQEVGVSRQGKAVVSDGGYGVIGG